jgi:DNA polymerase III epsilon subunit-like protein
MLTRSPSTVRRALSRLRAQGQPLGVVEIAQGLLALRAPVAPCVARRLVATALGCSPSALPERVEARHLRPAEEAAVVDVPLERARFVVVDLETTGLSAARSQILEIGAVRVEALRVQAEPGGRFATLVRPPAALPSRIAALTGIHEALVAEAPLPAEALGRFHDWLGRAGAAPFVAHNALFDARFVARGFDELGLAYAAPLLCTRRLARRLLPELGRYGLDSLCAHFGISNPERHRGPGDAEAAARVLVELLALARGIGVESVGALLDLQSQPVRRPRRSRPRGRGRPRRVGRT